MRGGEMGTAGGAREVTASAEIISVDAAANKVTFKGPRGVRTVIVQDPALQSKLPSLKPGQVVQLTYTEAMAASIQPAAK
jgi:L-ascorbate metabolism protein UlaG (beta-lactamase superfamily)